MEPYNIQAYLDAGCFEMKLALMVLVHGKTGGRVCDTGCHAFDNGRCRAYMKLVNQSKRSTIEPTETVKEEAARRGIGIREVRRQRRGQSFG